MAERHYIPVTADVPGLSDGLKALIRRAVRTALAAERVRIPCEIDVRVTDDNGIREINKNMRNVDMPTDVLSFPAFVFAPGSPPRAGDSGFIDPATGLAPLGDMIISLERVRNQAREYGHSVRRELAYLTVHSVLHLLGYDHLDEGPDKALMREREDVVMRELGLEKSEKSEKSEE